MGKILRLQRNGGEWNISEDEYRMIELAIEEDRAFVRLNDEKGQAILIRVATIDYVGEKPKRAFWHGYPLEADGKSFFRDGHKVVLEPHNFSEIVYLGDVPAVGASSIESPKEEGVSKYGIELTNKMRVSGKIYGDSK